MEKNSFIGLGRLVSLFISSCQLQTIQPGWFNGLKSLQSLFIDDTNLSLINMRSDSFKSLNKLKSLKLNKGSDYESLFNFGVILETPQRENLFIHLKSLEKTDISRIAITCIQSRRHRDGQNSICSR